VEETTENPHIGANENPYAIRSAIETLVHQTLQTKASTPQIHRPPQDRAGYKYSILKETNWKQQQVFTKSTRKTRPFHIKYSYNRKQLSKKDMNE
jgi:hypothetical protein